MIVKTQDNGAMKRFRRSSWRFQVTFQTPLKRLDEFVATVFGADESFGQALLIVDEEVFPASNLNALRGVPAEAEELDHDAVLKTTGAAEVAALLKAALGDSVDFAFVPTPKPFVIYADHDEYCTFFANNRSNLNRVAVPLKEHGFRQVVGWQRIF